MCIQHPSCLQNESVWRPQVNEHSHFVQTCVNVRGWIALTVHREHFCFDLILSKQKCQKLCCAATLNTAGQLKKEVDTWKKKEAQWTGPFRSSSSGNSCFIFVIMTEWDSTTHSERNLDFCIKLKCHLANDLCRKRWDTVENEQKRWYWIYFDMDGLISWGLDDLQICNSPWKEVAAVHNSCHNRDCDEITIDFQQIFWFCHLVWLLIEGKQMFIIVFHFTFFLRQFKKKTLHFISLCSRVLSRNKRGNKVCWLLPVI